MEKKNNHQDSSARFIVGTVVHSLAFIAFLSAVIFGISAILAYKEGLASDGSIEGFGAALGAVILFVIFLISGGIHQLLGYVGIPILFPSRRAESRGRRTAARVLLVTQTVTLVLDFILFAVILISFRS